jgi:hypothetical protein
MEETGILENPALLSSASPDFEPGRKTCHFVALYGFFLATPLTIIECTFGIVILLPSGA